MQDTDKKQISRYKYLVIGYWNLSGDCFLYLVSFDNLSFDIHLTFGF